MDTKIKTPPSMATEHLVGFDIRYDGPSLDNGAVLLKKSNITKPRMLHWLFWPTRFYRVGLSAYDMLKATEFREPVGIDFYKALCRWPEDDGHEKVAVAFEYSWGFGTFGLWESWENMLCRYQPQPEDNVAAFTVWDVAGPQPLMCGDYDVATISERELLGAAQSLTSTKNTPLSAPEKWQFLGYDVGSTGGYSPLQHPQDTAPEITDVEKYVPFSNRNEHGLFDDFENALYEARLANAYDSEDCPYFIWGVYIARNVKQLLMEM